MVTHSDEVASASFRRARDSASDPCAGVRKSGESTGLGMAEL